MPFSSRCRPPGCGRLAFVDALIIAQRTRRILWQNFIGTITVDAVGTVFAGLGFLNPLLAAFIHVASEMVFNLNSARLLPVPEGDRTLSSAEAATVKPA